MVFNYSHSNAPTTGQQPSAPFDLQQDQLKDVEAPSFLLAFIEKER